MKEIKKGEAKFRETYSRTQNCETCGYFDPNGGHRHMGLCLMKVPEADFTRNRPWTVTCKLWEKKGPKEK